MVKTTDETVRSAVAAGNVSVVAPDVALSVEVVFVCVPAAAPDGMFTSIAKVQDAPEASAPPASDRVPVPVSDDPGPQGGSGETVPAAVAPDSMAFRSSVKLIAVAAGDSAPLVMVNSSVAVSPAMAGPSKDLTKEMFRPLLTVMLSLAATPVAVTPPTVAVGALVVKAYVPPGNAAGRSMGTTMVQLSPADPAAASEPPVKDIPC